MKKLVTLRNFPRNKSYEVTARDIHLGTNTGNPAAQLRMHRTRGGRLPPRRGDLPSPPSPRGAGEPARVPPGK